MGIDNRMAVRKRKRVEKMNLLKGKGVGAAACCSILGERKSKEKSGNKQLARESGTTRFAAVPSCAEEFVLTFLCVIFGWKFGTEAGNYLAGKRK